MNVRAPMTEDELRLIGNARELIAIILELEEENANLRAAILSVNERLAELIVLDGTLTEMIARLESAVS